MGAGPPAARGVARPEGGGAGGPGAPPAVGAGSAGAVGRSPADPLYVAGPPGVHGAPRTWHGVHTPRHRGVHTGLVRSRQGTCHVAEGPPGPRQQDGVGIAGVTPAPASGERRGTAGAPGVRTVARGVTTRSSRLPLSPPESTHLHTARTPHTQPRPLTSTRG